jgi:hypothetical protein
MMTFINFFFKVLIASHVLGGICFILNELKHKYIGPQKLFDFYDFYKFICENNPLLLNYYDTDNNTDNNLDNNNKNNLDKPILKEDLLNYKKEEPFENKYLEKYKKFPNRYMFNDVELNEEIQIYESLISKYNDERTNAIKEIQSELTKIEELQKIFNENRSINIIKEDDKYIYEVNDFAKKQLQKYFGIDESQVKEMTVSPHSGKSTGGVVDKYVIPPNVKIKEIDIGWDAMKPKEFKVNAMSEFQELVDAKDFSISRAVVDSILSNLKTRKKHVHVLSVKCIEENTILDITLEKSHFIDTLKDNLSYFEDREMYEECAKIHNGIKTLEG